MFELNAAPTKYDATAGGVRAGRDVVRLFPGAQAVLRRLLTDESYAAVKVAVASSTTEPAFANTCLDALPADATGERGERVGELVEYRQIYPGSKGRQHFPALASQSGVPYEQMIFWDDCTYGDNCGDVARSCTGATCVRTPHGLTEELFDVGLRAFAAGRRGVVG